MTRFGLLPVYTRFREKHISLVNGDLLTQSVDQFVFSSFDGGYIPTETSIWGAARKRFYGEQHPTHFSALNMLGELYRYQNQNDKSRPGRQSIYQRYLKTIL